VLLGLVLLNTASEELACPRNDITTVRKSQLHALMLHEVPVFLTVLNGESQDSKQRPLTDGSVVN